MSDGTSYRRVIDALAEAGALVSSPGRSQTYCLCPAHPDHDPSLSVTWVGDGPKGGRTLVRCQLSAPCQTEDILAVLGLSMADLYDTPPFRGRGVSGHVSGRVSGRGERGGNRVRSGGEPDTVSATSPDMSGPVAKPVSGPVAGALSGGGAGRLELVATYDYTDKDGTVLYDIRRWRGGAVKYSARSFDRNGKARKGMPGKARRVLYRLPDVLAAETVYLCEGEKDADNVAAALSEAAEGSYAATSAPFGAANTKGRGESVWLPQYVEALRGRHVRIIVDRDKAGYAHGLYVLESLTGAAASVEVLEPVEGNDATDHLTSGRTLAELQHLTRDELVAKVAEFATSAPVAETVSGDMAEPVSGDTAGMAKPVSGDMAKGGEVRHLPARVSGPVADVAEGGEAGVRSDGEPDTTSATEADPAGARVFEFPRRSPNRGKGAPQFEARGGRIYEIRWRKEETETGAIEWVEDPWQVLGCDVELVAQVLGGMIGDEKADKLSQARLERFELVARHPENGEELFLTVPAREWRSGDWLEALWPDVEYSASRDGRAKVAQAIKAVSFNCERITEHEATGWRMLPGYGRAFIHAGGAITAKGMIPVPTALPGPLKHYELPAPATTPAELEAAAAHSVGLMTDAALTPRVGLVLAGVAYRAVLGRAEFVPAFVGNPGSGKTALSIVCLQHFAGAELTKPDSAKNVQMMDKHGASEKWALKYLNRAADVAVAFDDFAPDEGPAKAAAKMGHFIRAAFNGASRPKLNRESKMIEGEPPRGVAVLTAEMLPSVTSARERMLNIPSHWATVDLAAKQEIIRLQGKEAAQARATFMASVIQWAARRDADELTESVTRWENAAADNLSELGFTTRTCAHVARLYAGWRAAAQVMIDGGVWTDDEGREFVASRVWPACIEAAHADTDADEERDPGRLFLRLLGEALIGQDCHVATDAGKIPDELEPTACGWRPGIGDGVFMPGGVRIGYVRTHPKTGELRLLLLPKAAAPVAAKAAEQAGIQLGLTVPGISQALEVANVGLRVGTEKGKKQRQVRVRIAGMLERVWDLPLSAVWGDGEETPEDEAGGDGGPPDGGDAPAPTSPGGVVVKLDAPAACADCGAPASHALDGVPLHLGECDAPAANVSALPSAGSAVAAAPAELVEVTEPLPLDEETPTPAAVVEEAAPAAAPGPAAPGRRAARGAGLEVEATEVTEAQTWARSVGEELTDEQAAAVVERFHAVTGCRWKGAHGTIWSLLTGHTKWPSAKAPAPANLELFEDLRKTDDFWKQRSWITTPGEPGENSSVQAADVNAQYVASAASVELGEGDPVQYEPGDELPANLYKLPGWVRLAADVEAAPHGLELHAGLWVPNPLAVYLTRDKGLELQVEEALVWPVKRRALANLAGHFRDWSTELKADETRAGEYALRMVKSLYTKALGGYLSSDKGLTPAEWHRPDWFMLLKAQAEANMLRALDKLPEGCIPRAKYADCAFIEVSAGADLATWPNLDPIQPGRLDMTGEPLPASLFRGLKASPEAWRAAYATGQAATGAPEAVTA